MSELKRQTLRVVEAMVEYREGLLRPTHCLQWDSGGCHDIYSQPDETPSICPDHVELPCAS